MYITRNGFVPVASLALVLGLAACQPQPAGDGQPSSFSKALSVSDHAPRPSHRQPAARRVYLPPKPASAPLPYEPGVVLVRFRDDIGRGLVDTVAAELGLQRVGPRRSPSLKTERLRLVARETVEQAVARLNRDPRVLYAEPNWRIQLLNTPNDPRYPECWGLNNTGQTGGTTGADIDAPEAWDISIGSRDVVVAVLDTGVDYTHPDLADNMWTNSDEIGGNGVDDDGNGYIDDVRGWDFEHQVNDPMDDYGHGTHCAGTIGASGNNTLGVAGVNWRVSIMPLRIIGNQDLDAYCIDAAEGIHYAVDNGARIMSCSWWTVQHYSQTLEDAVVYADQHDVFLVAAAGNDSTNDDDPNYNHWPSEWPYDNIIAVAATNHDDGIAYFSNYGPTTVDLGAPGEDILSTVWPGGGYELKSGTSMATPHVAGVVALMLSIRPDLTKQEVRQFLFNTVDPLPDLQGVTVTGGRVNAYRVLAAISGVPLPPVALAGGDRTVEAGSQVTLDGSKSFDPNQDPLTFQWQFYPPAASTASLDDDGIATPSFTADVCGEYQAVLTVSDGNESSPPDTAHINALNFTPQSPVIETAHPYGNNEDQTWTITQPGAVVMALHFSQFDTESGYDFVYLLDGDDQQVAVYDGTIGPFTTALVEGNTIKVHFTSDGSVTRQGFVIDEIRWCDAGRCPAGLGDCDDDPSTGPDGCETSTSDDVLNCGWCGHACAFANAEASCDAGLCVMGNCLAGFTDCNGDPADGCEANFDDDPLNCGGCGNACGPYEHATAGCQSGQCAIGACDAGWDDCNGNLADGCEKDVTSDLANCGACGNACALPHVDGHVCRDGVCLPLGACSDVAQTGVETPHPYPNNYDDSWTVTVPGASQLAVHFASFSLEAHSDCIWDYVLLLDGQGNQFARLCGDLGEFYSDAIPGDTVQIVFHSDGSVTREGFLVDFVSACDSGCSAGYSNCDGDPQNGCESDTSSDVANCGGCGLVCGAPNTQSQCNNSVCLASSACLPGFADCNNNPADGCEVQLDSDPNHCGACGNACHYGHAVGVCVDGACQMGDCNTGWENCDGDEANGCEVSVATDPNNCGACDNACDLPNVHIHGCQQSVCTISECDEGWGDCDGLASTGCEHDVSADVDNCGRCGHACNFQNGSGDCQQGECVVASCDGGFADCDGDGSNGCEVNLQDDVMNCGTCDNACDFPNAQATCDAGTCQMGSCLTGYQDCNGDEGDGCEVDTASDPLNCGGCGTVCDLPNVGTNSCSAGMCVVGSSCVEISASISSEHPYQNNTYQTWVIQHPGAGRIRVHFAQFDVESGWDYVYLLDGGGAQVASFSGTLGSFWSDYVDGDTVQVVLDSDYSVTYYGFDIDAYEACVSACAPGFGDCDGLADNGCEQDVSADVQNCGGCGLACNFQNGSGDCSGGQCVIAACNDGFGDCDGDGYNGCEADFSSDVDNCGSCGSTCQVAHGSPACSSGFCVVAACDFPWDDCNGDPADGCESDTMNDVQNCNGCGQVCGPYLHATAGCENGACTVAGCSSGWADCDGIVDNGCERDVSSDPLNCGGCWLACADAPYVVSADCIDAACVISTCQEGWGDCDGDGRDGCEVNLAGDPENCGACGQACEFANGVGACQAGSCVLQGCQLGFDDCNGDPADGCETDLFADADNCGMCGYACGLPHAGAVCQAGFCVVDGCDQGFANCNNANDDGCEVSLLDDAANCGQCENTCDLPHASSVCVAGTCTVSACDQGFGDCDGEAVDGCETDLSSSPEDCGSCGNACAFAHAAAECRAGTCQMGACQAGYSDCNGDSTDGCEVDIGSDDENCGGCQQACHQGQHCQGGSCVCQDADGDGAATMPCGPDCNDDDATVGPAASEQCGDGIDNDCDGTTDEDCQEPDNTEGGGCGCSTEGHRGLGGLWLGLLLGLAMLRRRRD